MHVHIYETVFPIRDESAPESYRDHPEFATSPVQPNNVRDWLVRPVNRIAATVESPEAAADWHAQWIEDNPRPESFWGMYTPERMVVATAKALAERLNRVDGWCSDDEVLTVATFIPCPPDGDVHGCPVGRTIESRAWGA